MVSAASSGSAEMKLSVGSRGREMSWAGTEDASAVMELGPVRDGPALAFYKDLDQSQSTAPSHQTYLPILVFRI